MEVKLIPGQGNPNIKLELERLLMTCKSFKGCVAFWTISPDYFDFNALGEALKKTNSFFCTDIQLPTNLNRILEYRPKYYLERLCLSPISRAYAF